jgi:hypothetical protein
LQLSADQGLGGRRVRLAALHRLSDRTARGGRGLVPVLIRARLLSLGAERIAASLDLRVARRGVRRRCRSARSGRGTGRGLRAWCRARVGLRLRARVRLRLASSCRRGRRRGSRRLCGPRRLRWSGRCGGGWRDRNRLGSGGCGRRRGRFFLFLAREERSQDDHQRRNGERSRMHRDPFTKRAPELRSVRGFFFDGWASAEFYPAPQPRQSC